ncbi:hypothetical protein MNBD_GAMMA26-858 [hydrothermal vent metagenome]|uniref:DUF6471 domain-containing protein n=1 Tax=hydrothermal vent metagenome TaxID=652676 RepID=A0A3B1BXY4_9ZZZZ
MVVDSDDPGDIDKGGINAEGRCSQLRPPGDLIKDELRCRGMTYADLAELLRDSGAADFSEKSLKREIERGGFSAALMLHILCRIGCEKVDIGQLACIKKKCGW